MTENITKIAVIIGSVRDGRFGPTVANWFVEQAERHGGIEVELIDLLDYPLPLNMPSADNLDAETKTLHRQLQAKISDADAYAVVTPEYNHTTSPALSNTIDWFLQEWKAKPVGLISYGGMGGGLRAAEHLRQIFAELHAVTVRDMLSFHNPWGKFGEGDVPVAPEGSEEAAKVLLDQLVWWGQALRRARTEVPYVS
ncbi:NADPH-dependent FMN reductase [Actinopolyspora sp. H202]|uniref:NADPH-dependent FMN reductase n=1 Tax=Actinopolyspora sp. H202 TaxID=1500456 RepID=UPI003EE44044